MGLQSSMLTDAELLASYLADRDVACPGCGYNLRGCKSQQCPECAESIKLNVTHPGAAVITPWLVRTNLLALGGSCGVLAWMAIPETWHSVRQFPPSKWGTGRSSRAGEMFLEMLLCAAFVVVLAVCCWCLFGMLRASSEARAARCRRAVHALLAMQGIMAVLIAIALVSAR